MSGTASGPEPILLILLVAGSGGLLAPAPRWMPAAAAVAGFVVAYVLEGLSQCPIDIFSSCKADAEEAVLYAIAAPA